MKLFLFVNMVLSAGCFALVIIVTVHVMDNLHRTQMELDLQQKMLDSALDWQHSREWQIPPWRGDGDWYYDRARGRKRKI